MTKISELGPRSRGIDLKVKLVEKRDERQVTARATGQQHRVAEFLVADDSGSVLLSLWDDSIDSVEIGASYEIKNAYVNVFKNSMKLNTGKYGTMEKIEEEVEANTELNISEKFVDNPGRRF